MKSSSAVRYDRLRSPSSTLQSSSRFPKEKRFVVFHERPKNLPNITVRDLQPLVSSLSPSIKRGTSSQRSRVKQPSSIEAQGECVLEDNRCFGVYCWGFSEPKSHAKDINGHSVRQIYYGSDL